MVSILKCLKWNKIIKIVDDEYGINSNILIR